MSGMTTPSTAPTFRQFLTDAEPDAYSDWPEAVAAWLSMLDPEELEAEVLRRCDWGTKAAELYPAVLTEWILGQPTPREVQPDGT